MPISTEQLAVVLCIGRSPSTIFCTRLAIQTGYQPLQICAVYNSLPSTASPQLPIEFHPTSILQLFKGSKLEGEKESEKRSVRVE
jgi:hypothetical protein